MSELSLETTIKLISYFSGENYNKVYYFIEMCEFMVSCVKKACALIFVRSMRTKLNS